MSAELLREAAALMRERALNSADATVGPVTWTSTLGTDSHDSMTYLHYQSWQPAVALAVADWLDFCANQHLTGRYPTAVARAYLGRDA